MGDMSSGSTSFPSSSSTQDEISLFLRQILLRSSSSSSLAPTQMGNNARNDMSSTSVPAGFCSNKTAHENALLSPRSLPFQDGILALDSTTGIANSNRAFLSALASPNKGASENETDEYDFESEEGEALAEEVPPKSVPSRSSSKRSRAAEVHNLSEKRRRSRINEKLKALQNLIPNSNKTDKASMLDEAIEYLKQLQLQVQMLSIRNGLSSHPMFFPEGLEPLQLSWMRMELGEKNRSIPSNMTATLPLKQENPLHYSFNLPNNCTVVDQPSVPAQSYIINSDTSFGLESSIPGHIRPFQPRISSEIGREDILQHHQLNTNHSDTNPLGGSQVKDNSTLEACITEPNVILTSQLSR